jgi:hypothetical protein
MVLGKRFAIGGTMLVMVHCSASSGSMNVDYFLRSYSWYLINEKQLLGSNIKQLFGLHSEHMFVTIVAGPPCALLAFDSIGRRICWTTYETEYITLLGAYKN